MIKNKEKNIRDMVIRGSKIIHEIAEIEQKIESVEKYESCDVIEWQAVELYFGGNLYNGSICIKDRDIGIAVKCLIKDKLTKDLIKLKKEFLELENLI